MFFSVEITTEVGSGDVIIEKQPQFNHGPESHAIHLSRFPVRRGVAEK
jgi:hypothetical protein